MGDAYTPRHRQRYGHHHRKVREAVALRVAAGGVRCSRCGEPIEPGQRWDLSHLPGGGHDEYEGAAHASCNRATFTTGERPRKSASTKAGAPVVSLGACTKGCCPPLSEEARRRNAWFTGYEADPPPF